MTIYAIGADYANAETSLRAVADHGGKFVCRYASTPGNPKNLTGPELVRIRAAGLDVVSVFETTAMRALDGFDAGHADLISAREQHGALGLPDTAPVHFTVDFDMQVSQEQAVQEYFHGLDSAAGTSPVGVYGGVRACTFLWTLGLVEFVWQTYAWSGGKWAPVTHLRQVANGVNWGGFTVDVNEAHAADYGQWHYTPKEEPMIVEMPAGTHVQRCVNVAGYTKMRHANGWGHDVQVERLVWIGDSTVPEQPNYLPGGVGNGAGTPEGQAWLDDQPGPAEIPAGATQASLQYTADAEWTLGLSNV